MEKVGDFEEFGTKINGFLLFSGYGPVDKWYA
jgi:hypothetical protein